MSSLKFSIWIWVDTCNNDIIVKSTDIFFKLHRSIERQSDRIDIRTNWTPVSFRMPTPAEAKLAPTNNALPVSEGSRYGSGEGAPSCWPEKM